MSQPAEVRGAVTLGHLAVLLYLRDGLLQCLYAHLRR